MFHEGPLYLFWKHFHVKVIGLFTHHEKFEKQLHVHWRKQEITFHVKMQSAKSKNTIHIHVALNIYTNAMTVIAKMYLNISVAFHVLNVFFSQWDDYFWAILWFIIIFPFQFFPTRRVNWNLFYLRLAHAVFCLKGHALLTGWMQQQRELYIMVHTARTNRKTDGRFSPRENAQKCEILKLSVAWEGIANCNFVQRVPNEILESVFSYWK